MLCSYKNILWRNIILYYNHQQLLREPMKPTSTFIMGIPLSKHNLIIYHEFPLVTMVIGDKKFIDT